MMRKSNFQCRQNFPPLSTNLSIRILSIMNFFIIFANANCAKVVDTVQFQQKGGTPSGAGPDETRIREHSVFHIKLITLKLNHYGNIHLHYYLRCYCNSYQNFTRIFFMGRLASLRSRSCCNCFVVVPEWCFSRNRNVFSFGVHYDLSDRHNV